MESHYFCDSILVDLSDNEVIEQVYFSAENMKMKFFEFAGESAAFEKSYFSRISFFLFLFAFFSISAPSFSFTYSWTGGGDGSSWSDSSNWTSGDGGTSYPNADDDTAEILSAATITLDADITINELLIPRTNTETSDFSVTISSSSSEKLTVKSQIETLRPAGSGAGADATSTLVLDCDVDSPLLTLHSGGNVTISSGRTAIITSVAKTGGDTPAYTLSVEGTLESTSIDLGSSDSASYSLAVSSSGVVQAASLSADVGSVKNEGTIELTGDFVLSDGNFVSNLLKAGDRISVNGDISFNGAVSVNGSSDTLLEIISGGTVTSTGVITAEKLLLNSISSTRKGTFLLNSVAHKISKIACGASSKISLTVAGDVTVGSLTSVNNGTADGLKSDGNVELTAGGTIYFNSEYPVSASGGNIVINSPVSLLSDATLQCNGDIFFYDTLDSSSTGECVLSFMGGVSKTVAFSKNVGKNYALKNFLASQRLVSIENDIQFAVSNSADFDAGFSSDSADYSFTFTGNAKISGSNTFKEFTIDNSSFGSASTIKFEDGTTQAIGSFSAKGAIGNEVTIDSINGGEWNVAFSTSPTNSDFEYVVVKNSTSATELSLFNASDLISSDFSIADTDSSTTNWFSTVFYWIGPNGTSWLTASGGNWAADEDGNNTLPAGSYPSYTSGSSEIVVSNSASNILDASSLGAVSVLSLSVGTSDSAGENTAIKLGASDFSCANTDSASTTFENYGKVIFTDSGRILDSSGNAIMDNDSGTVVYSAGIGTVTDYGSDNDTADYNKLVIESGEWTVSGNIKAASSFTVESGGIFVLADGGEINSELTNEGNLFVQSGQSAIWADFTNESGGSVTVNGTLWFANDCSKIEDKGNWTFGADGIISFNESNDVEFDASEAASSNKYKISALAATGFALSFVGSSTSPMKISYFVDAAGRTKASSFEYVEFTDDVTFNAAAANTSGIVKFDGDATFASDSDSAFSGSVELASGKTLTNSGGGKVTISDFTENGSSVTNSGNGSISITKLTITSGSPESTFTGGGDSSKAITVSSAEYNSCDLSFYGFVNIVGGTAGNVTNSGTVEITSGDMTISSLSNASGSKLSL